MMTEAKVKQLQHESDSWKRLLVFIMDENIQLKNRIPEILKVKVNDTLLDGIETFQNKFVNQDQLISLLRNDISNLGEILLGGIYQDYNINEVESKIQKLRNAIINTEKEFSKLKFDFNTYLSENIY